MYETPQTWKSEVWWRNRPADERLYHATLPKRLARTLENDPDFIWYDLKEGENIIIQGEANASLKAAGTLRAVTLMDKPKRSGRWMDADDYIEMLKDSFDNQGGLPVMYGNPWLDKYVKGVFDVVVLDGLGEERKTEFAAHELGNLIRKRYEREKSTIIVSRYGVADLVNRYGNRLAPILAEYRPI